jgi:DNA-damage-inducible protein D
MNHTLPAVNSGFEALKKINEHQAEYWCARDLQPLLGYAQWRRFELAIERAKESCMSSGNQASDHFAGAGKMVDLGSGSQRELDDYHLSRFACYLIAQNGDPRKPEIAAAQQAVSSRRFKRTKPLARRCVMPESIAPAKHIKAVEKRLKSSGPQLLG